MNSEHENRKCILDIETTDFIPWNDSKIICIGIKDTNSHTIPVFYHDHEETLILRFLQYFNRKQFQEIIGYNRRDVELTYKLWVRIQQVLGGVDNVEQ